MSTYGAPPSVNTAKEIPAGSPNMSRKSAGIIARDLARAASARRLISAARSSRLTIRRITKT